MSRPLHARLIALALMGTMLAPLSVQARHSRAASEDSSGDPVVATVNGDAIHRSDVMQVLHQILPAGQEPSPADFQKLYPHIIDDLISRKLAYQEAVREGVPNDRDVKIAEAANNQQIVEQAYFNKVGKPAVTEDKLRQAYDDTVKTQGPQEEVHVRHILVKTEDEAKDIIKQLDDGADFQKLAKEKSIDKGNAQDGGDLGYLTKGTKIDPAFTEAVFSMQPNTFSKTPVKTSFGYHVIQVLDKRPAKVPTFEEAKANLRGQVAQVAIKQRLIELAKNAKIQVFNSDGTPIVKQPAGATAPAASPVAAPAQSLAPSASPAPAGSAPLQLPQTQSNQ